MSEFYFLDSNGVLLRISNHTLRNLHKYAHLYKKLPQDKADGNYELSVPPALSFVLQHNKLLGSLN